MCAHMQGNVGAPSMRPREEGQQAAAAVGVHPASSKGWNQRPARLPPPAGMVVKTPGLPSCWGDVDIHLYCNDFCMMNSVCTP